LRADQTAAGYYFIDIILFMYVANLVFPEDNISMYNIYIDPTQEHHVYLILYLTQGTNDGMRFRSKIFRTNKFPIIFYYDIRDEVCEIQLSHSPRVQDGRT